MSAGALLMALALVGPAGCSGTITGGGPTGGGKDRAAATDSQDLARFNNLLADLAERVKPGLVHVTRVQPAGENDSPTPVRRGRSIGSGFVIHPSGLIVTNAHVVDGGRLIEVRLADRRRFPGSVIGKDTRADLALVKIHGATNLGALSFGDSDRVRAGEVVLALGHPFGLEDAVSLGVVSRKGAGVAASAPDLDLIQTDAAINRRAPVRVDLGRAPALVT